VNRRDALVMLAGGLGLTAVARTLEAGHAAHTYHPLPQLPRLTKVMGPMEFTAEARARIALWRPIPPGTKDAFEVYFTSYRPR
jgi:hypothetical protein